MFQLSFIVTNVPPLNKMETYYVTGHTYCLYKQMTRFQQFLYNSISLNFTIL